MRGNTGAARLMVATTDGYVYIYNVDTRLGGECALVKQHRITGNNQVNAAQANTSRMLSVLI
jgi:autophagy-related protein 18